MFLVICFEYKFNVGFKTNTIITIVSVICEKMSKYYIDYHISTTVYEAYNCWTQTKYLRSLIHI